MMEESEGSDCERSVFRSEWLMMDGRKQGRGEQMASFIYCIFTRGFDLAVRRMVACSSTHCRPRLWLSVSGSNQKSAFHHAQE
jgi:hypothetical protein